MRLRYFDTCVAPVLLFNLHTIALSKQRIQQLDAIQRKMLGSVVGWKRIDDEPWEDTMRRMKHRLIRAQSLHYCQPWSMRFAYAQIRYAAHVASSETPLWIACMTQHCRLPVRDDMTSYPTQRRIGRPMLRWADHLSNFFVLRVGQGRHWSEVLSEMHVTEFEDEYAIFLAS